MPLPTFMQTIASIHTIDTAVSRSLGSKQSLTRDTLEVLSHPEALWPPVPRAKVVRRGGALQGPSLVRNNFEGPDDRSTVILNAYGR